jgi:hypothetical protein
MNNPPPVDEDEKGILLDAIAGLFIRTYAVRMITAL